MGQMLQAVVMGPGRLVFEEVDEPIPRPDEVIVELGACGICGTDRAIFRGDTPQEFPIVLGHEFSGTVVAAGSEVQTLSVGQQVAVDPNVTCGLCSYCRRDLPHLCSRLSPLGIARRGGYAERSAVPERNAHPLPGGVSLEEAALTEPLSCCVRGMQLANIGLGDTVVVLGAGPMGCLLIQVARMEGAASIIVSEPMPARRELALDLGADVVLDAGSDVAEVVFDRTQGVGADVVIEAAGKLATAEAALSLVRRGGTVLWFGVPPASERMQISPYWVNDNEITIRGSFNNPLTFSRSLELIGAGRVKVGPLITDSVPLREMEAALDLNNFPEAGKILVVP
jgi:2-desacetyl-2-hydroxyethyl bacteriochlorophyllide A dehydrogenase